jgi:hypothetical protein
MHANGSLSGFRLHARPAAVRGRAVARLSAGQKDVTKSLQYFLKKPVPFFFFALFIYSESAKQCAPLSEKSERRKCEKYWKSYKTDSETATHHAKIIIKKSFQIACG